MYGWKWFYECTVVVVRLVLVVRLVVVVWVVVVVWLDVVACLPCIAVSGYLSPHGSRVFNGCMARSFGMAFRVFV